MDATADKEGQGQLAPTGPTAQIARNEGRIVAFGGTEITDQTMYALIDAGRR